jgi:hypothetical protein
MFKLFKRKSKEPKPNPAQERIAGTIVRKVIELQERGALFMQRKTEKLSARAKKYGIIFFCLLSGGYSLYIMMESFTTKRQKILAVTNIKPSEYATQTGDGKLYSAPIISDIEYQKIVQFRRYMDSLSVSKTGKTIADSILLARPGLMDSVLQLEKLYQLQQTFKK